MGEVITGEKYFTVSPQSPKRQAPARPPATEYRDSDHEQHSNPYQPHSMSQPQQSQQGSSLGGMFSSLKGSAAGLFKNVKDASSKVMETVSA